MAPSCWVVSSDLRELMLICDRIGVLSAGRLIDTFERDNWTQDQLLAAASAGASGTRTLIQVGAWSLAFSSARTHLSTPAS